MNFGELVNYGNFNEVRNNLVKLQSELNLSIARIQVGATNDYTGYALQKICVYVSNQIEKKSLFLESSIEFNAWISRNLFESYLLSMYVVSDLEKAKEFLARKASDELDIYKAILSLNSSTDVSDNSKPIQDRIDHIKNTMLRHGLKYSQPFNMRDLAERTGNKDEYDAFYKLYSKYVHPSSWLIVAQMNEIDNPTFRNIFLLRSQYYVSRLLKIVSDYVNKQS